VATYIEIEFEKGDPVAIDGVRMSPATMLTALNTLGGDNGIGRLAGAYTRPRFSST
jgi:argininosuccinate synthase